MKSNMKHIPRWPAEPYLAEMTRFAPIAAKYGKDVAQIILRWELQRDIVVIPKSVKQKRILSNMDVFDFELEEADMK